MIFQVDPYIQPETVVYGSYATGLDLEDSDIDIVIKGFSNYNVHILKGFELCPREWISYKMHDLEKNLK
jgi:DNA polymerase sigma